MPLCLLLRTTTSLPVTTLTNAALPSLFRVIMTPLGVCDYLLYLTVAT